jgi:hypothetical protein
MKSLPLVAVWRNTIRDSGLDKTAKLVAFVLSTYMDAHGRAFPSKATLASGASLGEGRRAVDKAIVRLEEAGLLHVTRSKGRRPFQYRALTSQTGARLNDANGCDVHDSNVARPDFQRRTNGHSTSQTGATESGFESEKEGDATNLVGKGPEAPPLKCTRCGGDLSHFPGDPDFFLFCDPCNLTHDLRGKAAAA